MVTWLIRDSLAECPVGWQNFIEDLRDRIPYNDREGFSIDTINSELEPFRAWFYESGGNDFVNFKDEKRYNLFVLKYGGRQ